MEGKAFLFQGLAYIFVGVGPGWDTLSEGTQLW